MGSINHSCRSRVARRFAVMFALMASAIGAAACGDGDAMGRESDAGAVVGGDTGAGPSACEGQGDGEPCGADRFCRGGRCENNWCGDGFRAGSERCDDGDTLAGDGCDPACQPEPLACGDGRVGDEEECDDSNWIDRDQCSNQCTLNECGNGRVDPTEECDDADAIDDDECANDCLVYACRNGRVDPGEGCDDGNTIDRGDGCTNDCEVTICGNGKVEKYETCDDGNRADEVGGGCPSTCEYSVCGNHVTEPGEACDGPQIVEKMGDTPGYWRGCRADCRKWLEPEEDACGKCFNERCMNYLGFDFIKGCFQEPSIDVDADPADPFYIPQCIEVVNCALKQGCGTQIPDGDLATCYCGSATTDECAASGPARDAACKTEWITAARATTNNDVLLRLTDPHYPSGVAYPLLQCMGKAGPDACGLECDSTYCQRTRDPAHCNEDGTRATR